MKVCKYCGKSLTEFSENMMLGCPYCYEEFSSEIREVLLKVQGKVNHVGKVPKNYVDIEELQSTYRKLVENRQEYLNDKDIVSLIKVEKEIDLIKAELKKNGLDV